MRNAIRIEDTSLDIVGTVCVVVLPDHHITATFKTGSFRIIYRRSRCGVGHRRDAAAVSQIPGDDVIIGIVETKGLDIGKRARTAAALYRDGHAITADIIIGDIAGKNGDVGAIPAINNVIAAAADQCIVTCGGGEGVVAGRSGQDVTVRITGQQIVATATRKVFDAGKRINAETATDSLSAGLGEIDRYTPDSIGVIGGIYAVTTDQGVVAATTAERVIAGAAIQRVIAGATDEGVVGLAKTSVSPPPRSTVTLVPSVVMLFWMLCQFRS